MAPPAMPSKAIAHSTNVIGHKAIASKAKKAPNPAINIPAITNATPPIAFAILDLLRK